MKQYQAGRQLNMKAAEAAENLKCGKSQRLFISLYKNSSASLIHLKSHNRAGSWAQTFRPYLDRSSWFYPNYPAAPTVGVNEDIYQQNMFQLRILNAYELVTHPGQCKSKRQQERQYSVFTTASF